MSRGIKATLLTFSQRALEIGIYGIIKSTFETTADK
jgi:hypothetical protein